MNGKLLGVDYGDVRTGLAVSDPSGLIATGIGTIRPGGMRHTAVAVAEAARERACAAIVIGLPKNMDGSEGFRAETVRAFVALLGEETDLPLTLFDERLSTVEAHRMMGRRDATPLIPSPRRLFCRIIWIRRAARPAPDKTPPADCHKADCHKKEMPFLCVCFPLPACGSPPRRKRHAMTAISPL